MLTGDGPFFGAVFFHDVPDMTDKDDALVLTMVSNPFYLRLKIWIVTGSLLSGVCLQSLPR